jgi:hypothetical protein
MPPVFKATKVCTRCITGEAGLPTWKPDTWAASPQGYNPALAHQTLQKPDASQDDEMQSILRELVRHALQAAMHQMQHLVSHLHTPHLAGH